jgi:hypothetical protein
MIHYPGRRTINVLLLSLLVVVVTLTLSGCTDLRGEVKRLTWERVIVIATFDRWSVASWQDEVPLDGYDLSCTEKQRDIRQVQVGSHEECRNVDQGDGSFRRECATVPEYREEPVYDQWCEYHVDGWRMEEVTASGEGKDPPPAWPEYVLSEAVAEGDVPYGLQEVHDWRETYTIVIRDDEGRSWTCEFDEPTTWSQYDVGMEVTGQLGDDGLPDCETLRMAQ